LERRRFLRRFLGVPFGEAEIEDFLVVLTGDAAGLGAEAVDEPGSLANRALGGF